MEVIKKLEQLKIIPVAVIDDSADAIPLGKALLDAGLPVVEVTFRTEAAAESISFLRKEFPPLPASDCHRYLIGTVSMLRHNYQFSLTFPPGQIY